MNAHFGMFEKYPSLKAPEAQILLCVCELLDILVK